MIWLLLAKSEEELQRALEILYKLLRRFGLRMSLDETKPMIMSDSFDDDNYPETVCTLNNNNNNNGSSYIAHFTMSHAMRFTISGGL
jgi:type II secretory pathway component PulJ